MKEYVLKGKFSGNTIDFCYPLRHTGSKGRILFDCFKLFSNETNRFAFQKATNLQVAHEGKRCVLCVLIISGHVN